MLKNEFADKAMKADAEGWNTNQLKELLGRKREMVGIFDGNEQEGELEAGQSSGLIKNVLPAELIMKKLLAEINEANVRNQNLVTIKKSWH
jgi:enoyl-[acyl-carrier protein] reductase II